MYDADSHIMELPDFLQKYADPELRKDIPAVSYSASLVTDEEVAEIMARGGRHSEEHVAEMIALGDNLIESVERDPGAGRVRRPRALEGDRHARFQETAGVRDAQCHDAVFAELEDRAEAALRRGARAQPAHGGFLRARRAPDGRRDRAAGRAGTRARGTRLRAEERRRRPSGCRIMRAAAGRPDTSSSILSGRGWSSRTLRS